MKGYFVFSALFRLFAKNPICQVEFRKTSASPFSYSNRVACGWHHPFSDRGSGKHKTRFPALVQMAEGGPIILESSQGPERIDQIKYAVFEVNGHISVMPAAEK
ncbi:hypothetical protein HA50_22345 [Pantoea cypripedii]|uniref:Uncharacterized protein n=2 Tax=Pantoea cypripedii TaxID=55209 RepID=A0A1X1EKC1_PANCY|nr:hypothetical protein HA50_22345 [Pantoea cypripedii]